MGSKTKKYTKKQTTKSDIRRISAKFRPSPKDWEFFNSL